MYKHIKSGDVEKKDFGTLVIQKLMNDPDLQEISLGKVEVKGILKFTKNPVSDIYGYILQ